MRHFARSNGLKNKGGLNMEYTKKLVYGLLQYVRSDSEDTKVFQTLMHNADLCPKFQQQLDIVSQSFKKYRTITYDVQGIKDEGSDIIIRKSVDERPLYICLQVKHELYAS